MNEFKLFTKSKEIGEWDRNLLLKKLDIDLDTLKYMSPKIKEIIEEVRIDQRSRDLDLCENIKEKSRQDERAKVFPALAKHLGELEACRIVGILYEEIEKGEKQ